MPSVVDKLRKNSTIEITDLVSESVFFEDVDVVSTPIPAMNVLLSGRFDGGFASGHTMWAGPSKHFKTLFALVMAKSYLEKYPDSALLYYDNEFGTPKSYFSSLKIPTHRVVHSPLVHIEELKKDAIKQLEGLSRGDRVIMVIDSIGNIASYKELEDALAGKTVVDMTRAKALKSFFRMVTPYLSIIDIPLVSVGHTYKTQEMYSTDVVSGGTGGYYSADNLYVVGREQDKTGDELTGYNFKVRVEKSRFIRERSIIPITVGFDKGLSRWSGLFDMAIEAGFIVKPKEETPKNLTVAERKELRELKKKEKKEKTGSYSLAIDPDNTFTRRDTDSASFWNPILNDPENAFGKWVESRYRLGNASLLSDGEESCTA